MLQCTETCLTCRIFTSSTSVALKWVSTCKSSSVLDPSSNGCINSLFDRNAIAGGNTLGPLICGFIVTKHSWRYHKWIAVILTAVNFVAILFFLPETRFDRESTPLRDITNSLSSTFDMNAADGAKGAIRPMRLSSDGPQQTRQISKRSLIQELSLWSGTPSTNLFKMFLR